MTKDLTERRHLYAVQVDGVRYVFTEPAEIIEGDRHLFFIAPDGPCLEITRADASVVVVCLRRDVDLIKAACSGDDGVDCVEPFVGGR